MKQDLSLQLDMLCIATTLAASGKSDAYKKLKSQFAIKKDEL